MKTFVQYLEDQNVSASQLNAVNEALNSEWSPELEEQINQAIDAFLQEYKNVDGSYDIEKFNYEITNEGILGSIVGGLTGFALGKSVGMIVAKALGVERGILYDMLTSRLVGAALGAALGNRL